MIDPGMKNLAAILTNVNTLRPWIISGSNVLSINRRYHTLLEKAYSKLKKRYNRQKSPYISKLWDNRKSKLEAVFKLYSKRVVQYCQQHNIGKIIMGYNKNWKNKVNLGRKTNKEFCTIPYRMFIRQLFSKSEEYGIIFVENEESYTSKCDGLKLETFEKCRLRSEKYRVKRGLFKSQFQRYKNNKWSRTYINADINGAINIGRKYLTKVNNIPALEKLEHLIRNSVKMLLNPIKLTYKDMLSSLPIQLARTRHKFPAEEEGMGVSDAPSQIPKSKRSLGL